MQGEFPARRGARFSILLRGLAGGLPDIVGQAGQFGFVADDFGKGIGRIEQVFGKPGRQAGQLFLNRLVARLLFLRQFGTGKAEIAYLVIDNPAPGKRELRVLGTFPDRLVAGKKLEVLAKLGIEAADFGQHAVVGIAPLRYVIDRVQMSDDAPGA